MNWLDIAKYGTLLLIASASTVVSAQQLYKYTDKDGKVTYSDRVPKADEKAEPVDIDGKANIIPSKSATPGPPAAGKAGKAATPQKKGPDLSNLVERREKIRERLQAEVDAAQKSLDAAKAALENGRDIMPGETQIRVGRGKDGKPTGVNAQVQKPEYAERIAALEQAVKNAEEKLAAAEAKYRRGAPD